MSEEIKIGDRVETGDGDGYDTGAVDLCNDGSLMVHWDSGITTRITPTDLADLRKI